jgi:hypothetical protein
MKIAIKLSDSYKKGKRGWHASCRIRGHWLSKYWDELDDIFYPEYFKQTNGEFFELQNQLEKLKDYDAVILHKTYEWELSRELRIRGKKVIVDLSDPDYLLGFSNTQRAGLCLMTISNSDAVVVNNKLMIDDLKKGYDRPIFYIPDRIETDFIKPETLVWFGHSDNAESLIKYLPELKNYKIRVISDKPIEGTEFVPYDPETIDIEIRNADAVFLGDRLNEYKSPNRYLTAVSLGMPVYTIEALRDFSIQRSVKEWQEIMTKI